MTWTPAQGSAAMCHETFHCFPVRHLLTTAARPLVVYLISFGYPNLQREQSSQSSRVYHGGSAPSPPAMARVVSRGEDCSVCPPAPCTLQQQSLWSLTQMGEPSYFFFSWKAQVSCYCKEHSSVPSVATF